MVGCHSVPYLSVPYLSVPGRNGIFIKTGGRNDSKKNKFLIERKWLLISQKFIKSKTYISYTNESRNMPAFISALRLLATQVMAALILALSSPAAHNELPLSHSCLKEASAPTCCLVGRLEEFRALSLHCHGGLLPVSTRIQRSYGSSYTL